MVQNFLFFKETLPDATYIFKREINIKEKNIDAKALSKQKIMGRETS